MKDMLTATDIYNFQKKLGHILPEEEKNRLINIQSKIEDRSKLKKVTSRFGDHYEDCVWSNSNCKAGPDTCDCPYLDRLDNEAHKIMKPYTNIYRKLRCKHCK